MKERPVSPFPKFFGRRKGRPLRVRANALLIGLLPRVQIALPNEGQIDPLTLFEHRPQTAWLEIGFGGGEHLAAQAAENPSGGYIGCEPFVNGVASLLGHIDERKISNVRIYPDDARHLLDRLSEKCLDGCFVLYPDPWPKKRHAERRFINAENLDRLSRVLKSGAELRLATDVPALMGWMRDQVKGHPGFKIVYDGFEPPSGWIETRYERKGLKVGREPEYMMAQRV